MLYDEKKTNTIHILSPGKTKQRQPDLVIKENFQT